VAFLQQELPRVKLPDGRRESIEQILDRARRGEVLPPELGDRLLTVLKAPTVTGWEELIAEGRGSE